MKRFRLLIITTLLALSTSFSAFAGSWEEDSKGWWYKNDDGSYPRSTWFTFATTGKQYYFNNEGYLLVNTTTPDGYKVGSDGAYLESDPSNIAKAKSTKSGSYVNSGPGVVGSAGGPVQNTNSTTANNSSNSNNNSNSNSNNNNNSNSNSNSKPNTSTASNNNTNNKTNSSSGSAMISSSAPEPDTTTVLKSPS